MAIPVCSVTVTNNSQLFQDFHKWKELWKTQRRCCMVVIYIFGGIAVAELLFAFFGAALPLIKDKRRKGEKRV